MRSPMRAVHASLLAFLMLVACSHASFAQVPAPAVEGGQPSIFDKFFGGDADSRIARQVDAIDEALLKWDVEKADALAKELIGIHPGDAHALLAASRVRFYASDYEQARVLAQRATQSSDPDSKVGKDSASLVAWLDERASTWRSFHEERRGPFVVRTTPRDAILASYALDALEGARRAMEADVGFTPKDDVVIELYPTRRAFIAASTLSREEVETSGTLAICHFNRLMVLSPGVLSRGYDWLDALCHEYVHYAVYKAGANTVPVWLHEGIAKTLEARWRDSEPGPLDPRLASVLAEGLELGKWVTFEEMHPSMAKLPSAALVSMAFAEVTTTVRMMRDERGAGAIKSIVAALRQHDGDMNAALQQAWGVSLAGLEERARAHSQSMRLRRVPGLVAFDGKLDKPPGLDFSDEGGGEADPEADAKKLEDRQAQDWTILGDRLKGRRFFDAAIIEYDKALARLGAGDPMVVNKKAHALLLAGRPAEAQPILEESLRWNPALAATLENLCEVHVRLAAAATDPAVAEAESKRALELAIEAERVNPFSVDIHVRLATLHERFGNAAAASLARQRIAALRAL